MVGLAFFKAAFSQTKIVQRKASHNFSMSTQNYINYIQVVFI